MSDRFGPFQRAIHRMDLPLLGLDPTRAIAAWTSRILQSLGRHMPSPFRLNHATELLAQCMRRQFDLIINRRLFSLFQRLQFDRRLGRQNLNSTSPPTPIFAA